MGYLILDDLTEIERRLVEAVINGEQLDLVAPDEEISSEAMTDWGQDRTVRGELIRQILLDRFGWPGGDQPDPRGVRLRGARLAGTRSLRGRVPVAAEPDRLPYH